MAIVRAASDEAAAERLRSSLDTGASELLVLYDQLSASHLTVHAGAPVTLRSSSSASIDQAVASCVVGGAQLSWATLGNLCLRGSWSVAQYPVIAKDTHQSTSQRHNLLIVQVM